MAPDADNLDGAVDTVDFSFLAAHFGQSNQTWTHGDYNFDGFVDTIDFGFLASNFGLFAPAHAGPSSLGAVVPEPGTAMLLAIPAIGALSRRRRRA